MRPLLADKSTDLFVDGFPRSANSFVFYALRLANPALAVRGHTHSSDAIRAALDLGVPTLVLVREPRGCVASLVQFVPGLTPHAAMTHYRRFFRAILPLVPRATAASFGEVTTNLHRTIERLNSATGIQVRSYEPTPTNDRALRERLDRSNNEYASGGDRTAPRPTTARRPADEILFNLSIRDQKLLRECIDLYNRVFADTP